MFLSVELLRSRHNALFDDDELMTMASVSVHFFSQVSFPAIDPAHNVACVFSSFFLSFFLSFAHSLVSLCLQRTRIRLLENDIRIMRSDVQRINHETTNQKEKIKENQEKIKLNKQLPYLVGNVVEVLDADAEDGLEKEEEDGAATDVDAVRKTKSAVIRTSTRQTIYLPVPGLVDVEELKPSDMVGTNKDSYLILEKLPAEYDSRVKAMEVDERPEEEYSDIGGADKQIQGECKRPLVFKVRQRSAVQCSAARHAAAERMTSF